MSEDTPSPRSAEELVDPYGELRTKAILGTEARVRAGDPKALKDKAVTDKQREFEEEADLVAVARTEAGRRLLARLILTCGWNQPHFNPSNSIMCEVAGRRSIAYQIERWLSEADLELWIGVRRELEKLLPKQPKVGADKARGR